jgi:hypothetical protein
VDDVPRIRTEIQINGEWVDISLHVLNRQELVINWGRKDEASRVTHTKVAPQINNRDGQYSDDNPYSPYFGLLGENTRIRQSVQLPDGTWSFRFHCEIPAWPQRWDLSGNDVYVPVQAAGMLRRLGQGKRPLHDALRRHIEAGIPLAYWPLTDGEDARQGSEVARGSQPLRAIGTAGSFFQGQPDWGKGTLATWLDPVVELPANTEGILSARVQQQPLTTWTCDHFRAGVGGVEDDLTVFDNGTGSDTDPVNAWIVVADHTVDEVVLRLLSAGETTSSIAVLATVSDPGIFDLSPHMIRVSATANGASTDWQLVIDGAGAASGTYAVPHRPVSRVRYRWGAFASLTDPLALGHLTLWQTPPAAAATYAALRGHERELAGRRIERLCAEQGVPLQVNGNLDQSPAMGPQKPAKFLDLLDDAAKVDGGVVHEARDAFALAYRTNRSRYNQGV